MGHHQIGKPRDSRLEHRPPLNDISFLIKTGDCNLARDTDAVPAGDAASGRLAARSINLIYLEGFVGGSDNSTVDTARARDERDYVLPFFLGGVWEGFIVFDRLDGDAGETPASRKGGELGWWAIDRDTERSELGRFDQSEDFYGIHTYLCIKFAEQRTRVEALTSIFGARAGRATARAISRKMRMLAPRV